VVHRAMDAGDSIGARERNGSTRDQGYGHAVHVPPSAPAEAKFHPVGAERAHD